MNLKNYTSKVEADTSLARIERLLVGIGASAINKQYADGDVSSINFLILVKGRTLVFRLAPKVDTVFKVLWKEVKRPQPGTKKRTQAQAVRTAWKIIHDWVEVQCAMILLEQAEVAQLFLPYVYDPSSDTTLWDRIEKGDLKLLN